VENANEIVRSNGIGDVPGQSNMKICMSLTQDEPHLLRIANAGKKVSCDCKGYESKNLCAHVIATAYKLKTLEDIILLWEPNLTWQLSTSLPAGSGKNQTRRGREKAPVTEIPVNIASGMRQRMTNIMWFFFLKLELRHAMVVNNKVRFLTSVADWMKNVQRSRHTRRDSTMRLFSF
jgi:hypothetical protein